jgi:Fic family protein
MNALGSLETFLHDDTPLPTLVKIGLVHSQFETIHPFLDGNGRIGRLLITFLLCQSEILQKPVLYISHYFRRYRTEYYDKLQLVRDTGDWEGWLKFFLTGIAEVSKEATETARQIVALRENHRAVITERFGRSAGSGLRVFESMFQRPIISVSEISDMLGVTFPAANDLVQRFEAQGILQEITGQKRYRLFRYTPYIDLFADRAAKEEREQAAEPPVVTAAAE